MAIWTIKDFVEASGKCPIWDWLSSEIPPEAKAHIDARILQMMNLLHWSEKWISAYKNSDKILELRIPFQKVQYRPLGIYQPGRTLILLEGAIEKDGKLTTGALGRAESRAALLDREPNHVREHRFN